ncbi:hypothetical protein BDB01DRAFT_815775 [Pilobolus umbonatus]|nr:hypothetical protein BDB01DRAFT_815775 [Pilobolus umbonatus]
MIALYVHNTTATPTRSLKYQWNLITNRNDRMVKSRQWPQYIANPERTKLFLQGGNSVPGNTLDYPFLAFNTTSEAWYPLPDFEPPDVKWGQIHQGTVAYVSSINKLVYYGGLTLVPNIDVITSPNVTSLLQTDSYGYYLPFGFRRPSTYDMETQQWEEVFNETGQDTTYYYSAHNAVSGCNKMYILGGVKRLQSNPAFVSPRGFSSISELTLPDYTWTTYSLEEGVPTVRDHPTATLMPDHKTILLFGKDKYSVGDEAYQQVCHLLDLETKEWRRCPIEVPDNINILRDSHAAVLVQSNLFIIFGEFNNTFFDDILVFDVSDLNHIRYVEEYAYLDLSNTGLRAEAIAGITIGCIALAALIVGGVLYFRKKRAAKNLDDSYDFPSDWDEIVSNSIIKPVEAVLPKQIEEVPPVMAKPAEITSPTSAKPMELGTTSSSKPNS